MVVSLTPFNLFDEFPSIAEAIVEFSYERDLSALGPEYCYPTFLIGLPSHPVLSHNLLGIMPFKEQNVPHHQRQDLHC